MECLLIAMNVLIIEISIFVKPHRQPERPPTTRFIHYDLPALELFLFWRSQPTTLPNGPRSFAVCKFKIRPEDGTGLGKLRCFKQITGIQRWDIVRVHQEHF